MQKFDNNSAFIDIPWDAPFYTKLGFEVVDEWELTPGFQEIRQKEADLGLTITQRVVMFKKNRLLAKVNPY